MLYLSQNVAMGSYTSQDSVLITHVHCSSDDEISKVSVVDGRGSGLTSIVLSNAPLL